VRLAPAALLCLLAAAGPVQAAPGVSAGEARIRELLEGAPPSHGALDVEATIFVDRSPLTSPRAAGGSGPTAVASRAVLALSVDLSALGSEGAVPDRLELDLGVAFEDGRDQLVRHEISRPPETRDLRWAHRIRLVLPGRVGEIDQVALVLTDLASGQHGELALRPVVSDLPSAEWGTEIPEPQPSGEPPAIRLVLPPDPVLVGRQEISALVGRRGVDRVRFLVDGRTVETDRDEPWRVTHLFDRSGLPRTIEVVALDSDGRVLEREVALANAPADQPWLRLLTAPAGGGGQRATVSLRAAVGHSLSALELYAGERLLAVLLHEPFELELGSEETSAPYLRAVAIFDDGSLIEDVAAQFAEGFGEIVDVSLQLVDLFPRVVDETGRPAQVDSQSLELLVDGEPWHIERVLPASQLPLLLGIAVDTSGSMGLYVDRLKVELLGLLGVLDPGRDRAFLTHFSDVSHLDQAPTSEPARLARALRDVEIGGYTALYDGIVHALIQFDRKSSRRAVVVLTDGDSTVGRFTEDDALGVAQRLSVPVFAMVPKEVVQEAVTSLRIGGKMLQLIHLRRLAEESGGALIEVGGPEDLAPRLAEIFAELRAQTMVTFSPPQEASSRWKRHRVEIRSKQPGVRVEGELGYFSGTD